MMQGTFGDAHHWFYSPSEEALSSILGIVREDDYRPALLDVVDAGYDMWVGGLRGSKYNLGHTSKDWQDQSSGYFNFGVENKGMEDLPSIIKKVQEVSNVEKVTYAGYS